MTQNYRGSLSLIQELHPTNLFIFFACLGNAESSDAVSFSESREVEDVLDQSIDRNFIDEPHYQYELR